VSGARADAFLVEKGYFPSRAKARAAILAGEVTVNGQPFAKAGQQIPDGAVVEVARAPRFVSRGAEKLEVALDAFGIDVAGSRVLDAGASTGGFTDILLAQGAREVVAVDVGYGQFAWKLRNDSRVRLLERTNIRHVTVSEIGGPCDMAVADLSFISLKLTVETIVGLVEGGGPVLVLFKPQFEAGKGRVGKGGVVRDASLHFELLEDFAQWAAERGLGPRGLAVSEPRGARGNVEFWWYLSSGAERDVDESAIAAVVARAHG
jgi:23S rRNA (cytidine1920-2'-O)/16S rRNA (cytidine1409-2'-O)-methyltransferase